MKKVAIVQSNYIPWKGYFDLIAAVDEFVLLDDVQYTRRDWRNRNQIKTPQGQQWLTIPVQVKGRYTQTIRETLIQGQEWAGRHWKTLDQYYRRAGYFEEVSRLLQPIYFRGHTHLSELNRELIEKVCEYLGIHTPIHSSADFDLASDPTDRLVKLCRELGATEYVSGQAARSYMDVGAFAKHGIAVRWFDYDGYPEYPQLWGEFTHTVSVVDLLFNCGPESPRWMRYVEGSGSITNGALGR